jgi:hypothetical protein
LRSPLSTPSCYVVTSFAYKRSHHGAVFASTTRRHGLSAIPYTKTLRMCVNDRLYKVQIRVCTFRMHITNPSLMHFHDITNCIGLRHTRIVCLWVEVLFRIHGIYNKRMFYLSEDMFIYSEARRQGSTRSPGRRAVQVDAQSRGRAVRGRLLVSMALGPSCRSVFGF